MIYLTDIKRRILRLMRDTQGEHLGTSDIASSEHLGTSDIASSLNEPVFRIRAEMQDLVRQRLVRQDTSRRRLEWALTDAGTRLVWEELQLRLDP